MAAGWEDGYERIRWTADKMPLLRAIADEFTTSRPFGSLTIGVSLHLEPKTAALLLALRAGGARVVAAGNHGSTQDDVVAYLRAVGVDARGSRSDSRARHHAVVQSVIASEPDLLLDNGADLTALVAGRPTSVIGGTEETTSGRARLDDELRDRVTFPIVVINDSPLKSIVENQHGVGQAVVESFQRITNLMPQGKRWLVVGYGWCGRGIAHYARSLGARVSVAEVDEVKALEAAMDGYRVGTSIDLVCESDVVITATGRDRVVDRRHFEVAADGVIFGNAGHFPSEIAVEDLRAAAAHTVSFRDGIDRYALADGRHLDVITDGRMMNLAGTHPKGNSIETMDLGFSLQARSLEHLVRHPGTLAAGAQPVPGSINRALAAEMVRRMMSPTSPNSNGADSPLAPVPSTVGVTAG